MISQGRKALFFILGLVIVTGSVIFLREKPTKPQPVPSLWFFYARATGLKETLYGRHYSARGRPLGPPVRIGKLGLIQETDDAAPAPGGWEWVTLGRSVVGLYHGHVASRRPAPADQDILSIAESPQGQLDAVVERAQSNRVAIDQWRGGHWQTLLAGLPIGITTLVQGPRSSTWALVAQPTRAYLDEVQGGHQRYRTPTLQPQGTVGFFGSEPVLPYATGVDTFGFWTGRRHQFSSVYHAAVSVADTAPLWGLGVRGMIPFLHGRFLPEKVVPWPHRMPTTPEPLVSGQSSWVAILSGFSQGTWFNVKTGRFGPSFQIKTPWWAVVRAASLGS